jgi:hypothetical protein
VVKIAASSKTKKTRERGMSEPGIYWILEKWLERHPEVKGRERDIEIARPTSDLAEQLVDRLARGD